MEFYHNPRCRKSREALELLNGKGLEPEIRLYLEDTPSVKELKAVLKKLQLEPAALLRKGEPAYKEHVKGHDHSEAKLIELMVQFPKLIERPILINGKKAAVGRPPEKVLDIL